MENKYRATIQILYTAKIYDKDDQVIAVKDFQSEETAKEWIKKQIKGYQVIDKIIEGGQYERNRT